MKSIKFLLFAIFLAIIGSVDLSHSVNIIYTYMIVAIRFMAVIIAVVALFIPDKK